MLNMIKMDLYRMVRTKSMYVVWIVMAAAIFFSTSMSKLDIDTMNKEAEQQQTENIAETVKPETINMGMSVFLPTQPGEKVTVFDFENDDMFEYSFTQKIPVMIYNGELEIDLSRFA